MILPVYNAEKHLRRCLDSLLAQTLRDIEIILINDCSTDQSGVICEEYAKKDARITVIHNDQNIRQGPSRNKGIELARGEYIGFVDSDDWIDPDYYEKLYQAAITENADIAKTEAIIVERDQQLIPQKTQNQAIRAGLNAGKPLYDLFRYEHWTAIYRRDMLIQYHIRYPDIRNAQDDVFLLYCTWHCRKIALISDTYYYYRQHDQSVLATKKTPYYESILRCFELQVDFLNRVEIPEEQYMESFFLAFYPVRYHAAHLPEEVNLQFGAEYRQRAAVILQKCRFGGAEKILALLLAGLDGPEEIDRIRKSYTYRIGNRLLWLPNKLMSLLFGKNENRL